MGAVRDISNRITNTDGPPLSEISECYASLPILDPSLSTGLCLQLQAYKQLSDGFNTACSHKDMPLGIVSTLVGDVDNSTLITGALVVGTAYAAKVYASGRKSIWERDWTGKLIMIAVSAPPTIILHQAPPTPTTLALIDHLLHLPIPPQILYLPPVPSPLPESLLTIMHTMRLGIKSPLAQLHVEALPPTPTAVRDFVRKWAGAPMGTVGEGGRRVDAIVLGGGWECALPNPPSLDPAEDPEWTPNQFQYHFITSLLPSLLRAPAERDIRVITLVSPAWAAAMPGIQAGLEGKRISAAQDTGLTAAAAKRGVTSLLLQNQLALVLDTLASAAFSKRELVPDPDQPVKRRDESLQSNILALSVVMPWARDEVVRPVWGQGSFQWLL